MKNNYYSEAVESALRTITNAQPHLRQSVFETQAPDAFEFAKAAGRDKVEIVDRLESLTTEWGWSAEERQARIAAAIAKGEAELDEPADPAGAAENVPGEAHFSDDDAPSALDDGDPRPPQFSDESLAVFFADWHTDLRYIAKLGRWFVYDGQVWREDDTLIARHRARRTCRAGAAQCEQPRIAKAIASAKTVAGVERLAQSDRRIAATVDQFDRDAFLLNTPGGVVDLRTGQVHNHDREFCLTKITGVAPDFAMATPVWDAFLKRITAEDDELVAYLQRMAGYSLTGSTEEHALFFCYGVGKNGKSTFINAITAAAGDYHRTAPIETFISSNHDRHPTELAGLRGARIVTSIETEDGRRWAESRIKTLTGGDRISARFMRQDFFEYTPQFKLIIAGNHRPGLRSVDEAMKRRFNLIPFTVTIPDQERDTGLGDKLKLEHPGILAWMLRGCAQWRANGLAPPKAVTSATAAYLEGEDEIAAWLDEMAERDANGFTKSVDLFGSWSAWADKAGVYVGSGKRFHQALETRGFTAHRHKQLGRGFQGIRLKDVAATA